MAKENTASHAFFFTIMFMTSIVILTIVGYFLFLPNTAPKLITVAVLPFDAPDEFPKHLTRAFPRHITELLAASREVFVVDYDAAEEVVALSNKSRGFRNELGTTHIVDGNFAVVDPQQEQWVLNMRLIDVSKDIWKLKWDDQFAHPELSLLEIRNSIVTSVSEGLYDNSIPDPKSDQLDVDRLERYLRADSQFRKSSSVDALLDLMYGEEHFSPYVSGLYVKIFPDSSMSSRKYWVNQALAHHSNYYPAKILQAQISYESNKNLGTYLDEIVFLAGEYPNSDAVQELALLYSDFGWYKEAENVLLRWAQIRPRSVEPALAIAFNRFRKNDLKGAEEAMEIARLREPGNQLVERYRALYEWKVNGKALDADSLEYLNWIARSENGDFSRTDPQWITFVEGLSCFDQVELSLYLNIYDYIFEDIDCIDRRLWLQPPPWWIDDDPMWIAFREDSRYDSWLESKGVRSEVLETVEPVPARELFVPRRRVLNSRSDQTDQGLPSP